MHAGQIVRTARQAKSMTLAELGAYCGYSPAQLSRYECGKTPLTDITLLRRFADVLGISPTALGLASTRLDGPIIVEPRPFASGGQRLGGGGGEDEMRRRSL